MASFIIKIGKAWSVLRRDGFLNGFKRVLTAFLKQYERVDSGDVLFVTGGVGDSAMYRAENVSEELDLNGILSSVAYADSPYLLKYAESFKVFVFHRVAYNKKIEKLIEVIKKQNKEIIFETDDLLYEGDLIKNTDYFKNINSLEKKLYENGLGGEIINDSYVKVCTTTTSFLAEKLREKGKQIFIVPNRLSQEDVAIADAIASKKLQVHQVHQDIQNESLPDNQSPITDNKNIRIGYFSGTISHNKDFATITDALMQILEKHSNVELFLAGPLEVENKLSKFSDRIKQIPYAPREKHFENISNVDINIVPLEQGNPFCESKSELKFFEAGIVGVPTVAVSNQTFSEAISDGIDGFLAKNTEEWVEKIQRLILEKPLRKEMGQRAREKSLASYCTKTANNREYYEYLRDKII